MSEAHQEDDAVGLTPVAAPVSSSPSIHVTLPPSPPLSASDHKDTESEGHTMESQLSLDSEPSKPANGAAQPELLSQSDIMDELLPAQPQPNDIPPQISQPKPQHTQPAPPSRSIAQTLTSPKQWLSEYSTFIQKNASSVSQIESALRSLTYIIPGRFRDAEIASESLHTGIQLLSLYHDTVLARAVSKLPGMPRIQSAHSRYTKYWSSTNARYRKIALLLQCAQYTELLWEMAAKRRGEKVRWRVVVLIESLKAICRLLLLRITGGRMVVPPLPDREAIPEDSADDEDEEEDSDDLLPQEPKKAKEWTMPRTGLTLPALPSAGDISSFLMQKVLTADDIKPPTALLPRISGAAQAAEVLHILRPVLYALAMQRAKSKSDWRPWLAGIAIELTARQLRSFEKNRKGYGRESEMEKAEWSRRGWAMGWWTLRGAFYENVTKAWVDGLVGARYMPGIIGGVLEDYAFLWEEYHFASDDM